MRIDLTNYNATPTSTFRIYRSYKTFTQDNLPPVLAEVPATAKEYLDNTVELNRVVYYRISVIHNAVEIVGPLYTTIKKYYTGPQVNVGSSDPDSILRGNGEIGRYGSLPMSSVYASSQIPEDFPTLTIIEGVDVDATNVEKCIYNDKVLFISDTPMYMGSLEDLYKVGMLFSNGDGDGQSRMTTELYSSITTKVQQGRLIHSNGFTYRPRLITESEYLNLYSKLFPSSYYGSHQECVIANCLPHNKETLVSGNALVGSVNNPTYRLSGFIGRSDWVSKWPLLLILELVSRADAAFPEPDVEVKPTLPEDRMMYCGGEVVNNRVHFFGGIYSTFTTGMEATNRHISFDLNGENEQVHAPMPFGVYKQVTWTYDNKIYSFGGVRKIGTTEWGYQELYNDIQVWEDDGTPEGNWHVLPSNVTYGFDSCGTTYYDSGLDKNLILIFGGYDGLQPAITSTYYYADVTTFDGTFQNARSYVGNRSGGGAMKAYDGDMYFVGGVNTSNGYTSNLLKTPLPINPPSPLSMGSVKTQGSELPSTKGGKMFIWRDTLFLVTESSFDDVAANKMYVFQWSPSESRWLKITANDPEISEVKWAIGTATFNGNRIYTLISAPWLNDASTSRLVIIDLVDPLDAPLVPVNMVEVTVDRIYAPFAKVVQS